MRNKARVRIGRNRRRLLPGPNRRVPRRGRGTLRPRTDGLSPRGTTTRQTSSIQTAAAQTRALTKLRWEKAKQTGRGSGGCSQPVARQQQHQHTTPKPDPNQQHHGDQVKTYDRGIKGMYVQSIACCRRIPSLNRATKISSCPNR